MPIPPQMLFIPLLFSDHSGAHTTIGRAILIINQAALNSRAAGEVTVSTNVCCRVTLHYYLAPGSDEAQLIFNICLGQPILQAFMSMNCRFCPSKTMSVLDSKLHTSPPAHHNFCCK